MRLHRRAHRVTRDTSRDISRRAKTRGRDGDVRLGWTANESLEFHATRRREANAEDDEEGDARRLIDSFPNAFPSRLCWDWRGYERDS